MWLFTTDGFYSIVSKDCTHREVCIRARAREDLEKLKGVILDRSAIIVSGRMTITEYDHSDYRFRMVVSREDFKAYLDDYVDSLKYDNFKNTIPLRDRDRHDAYVGVWQSMYWFQQKIVNKIKTLNKKKGFK